MIALMLKRCDFFVQGLYKTEHRTGVLIFASAAERYAEIVADAGVNEKVTPLVWREAIAALTTAIKDGRPGDASLQRSKSAPRTWRRIFRPARSSATNFRTGSWKFRWEHGVGRSD